MRSDAATTVLNEQFSNRNRVELSEHKIPSKIDWYTKLLHKSIAKLLQQTKSFGSAESQAATATAVAVLQLWSCYVVAVCERRNATGKKR